MTDHLTNDIPEKELEFSLEDRIAMTEAYLNPPEPTEAMKSMSERFMRQYPKEVSE
jgi:hypothetical protein